MKIITQKELQAFRLIMLARKHTRNDFEALDLTNYLLKLDKSNHISNEIHSPQRKLDEILGLQGINIE